MAYWPIDHMYLIDQACYTAKNHGRSLMLDIIHCGNHTLLTAVNNPLNITQDWFAPDYWQCKDAIIAEKKGRSTTWFFDYSNGIGVLRHYWRGGLVGRLLSDQYIYTGLKETRTYKEYALLVELETRGLNVPKPLAAKVANRGLIYRGDLITQAIPNAESLLDLLKTRALSDDEIITIGKTIADFHQQGVFHADLNINNIMLDTNGKVYIIDFDRGRLVKPLHPCLKDNIQRLNRSFIKEKGRNSCFYWDPTQWQLLLNAYQSN
ncbi:MAG: 3-deoxy-D-manno-octulosonic acid kinase [Porticoccaceae bacterium]|nr:3-deoxy-D-manno-octulosonic acid kinase [Porticoccaceae bacterium]